VPFGNNSRAASTIGCVLRYAGSLGRSTPNKRPASKRIGWGVVDLSDATGDYQIYTAEVIEGRVEVREGDILIIHWHFVNGESCIGRCVAMVDDDEYEALMARKAGMPKTRFGDCYEPEHAKCINRLTRRF
jgi:hypothetical protein